MKKGDTIQGRTLNKGGHYLRKYSIFLSLYGMADKAELLQEGIFFRLQLFARDVLVMKKLEIEKSKPTFIISILKVEN